ncbi:FAD-binding oxidoreductase [Wenzhouxiangella sp. XN201]|uniref:FAD-binding oxidoreductase n=1 Tax=Wenzhouxiangella sp. XN201 TaxID=2710755 RepID=UPI0013CAD9D9|nr:FAD-binding oxidoreductase [Wenzhouxiangella sp. XN201]NEZ02689.1 FAD-binding oxidoreductase [Wenzhouxiangella sp. XN201]
MSDAFGTHFLERLQRLLGPGGVITELDEMARHVEEPRRRYHRRPLAVVRPASTQQVAAVVAHCREAGVAIVPQGGNTGLVGGQSVGGSGREVILSLERMREIRDIDAEGASLVVEAGCTLARVQEAAASAGLLFPMSLASEGTATIGGNIATNAGGHLTVRYGNMRQQVLGLEVVLADGRILDGLTVLRKDNSGYDLNQLFIGSEGTLGIITAASLQMVSAPRQSLTGLIAIDSLEHAVVLLRLLRHQLGETISALELMPRLALDFVLEYLPDVHDPLVRPHPWYLLLQADTALAGDWLQGACVKALERGSDEGVTTDAIVAGSDAQAQLLWRLRESISPAQKMGGASLKHDISVPVAAIPEFVETTSRALADTVPGIRPCVFGHVGDGNLHFNLSQPEDMTAEAFHAFEADCNRIVFDQVVRFRGSIAAEHGIGQLRAAELAARADSVRLDTMARLKSCLDPDELLNPGKVLIGKMPP